MTEKGYEGESSSPWDMPGPSSLGAILDTAFASTSENLPRNEEMECDALFAESDDDVEVLPTSSDATSSSRNEQPSKPVISSNYVNSTSPNRSYEVNVAQLSHPMSSHTPVPEEYQPLPDSSSSLEYVLQRNNADNANINEQRFPDINIRYQPKPMTNDQQRGYYYPNYTHYPAGTRPSREYIVNPYQRNNVIILSDDRNYLARPSSYSIPPNQTLIEDHNIPQPTRFDVQHNISNTYSHVPATGNIRSIHNVPWHLLERPSRKLNISPNRRQSKENEINSILIDVSSEEEDSVATPIKRLCDKGAGHGNTNTVQTSRANYTHSTLPSRVDIKRELHDNEEVPTQAASDTDMGRDTRQSVCTCVRRLGNCQASAHATPIAKCNTTCMQSLPPLRVKQETVGCPNSHGHSCSCRSNHMHGGCGHSRPDHYQECHRHSPGHFDCQHGSHHHHHHRILRQCPPNVNSIPGPSDPSTSRVKEEIHAQVINIKRESNSPEVQRPEGNNTSPSMPTIKTESVDQSRVKVEPNGASSTENVSPTVQNVAVKSEINEDTQGRCCNVGAAGDRQAKNSSPQPGTSLGREPMPSASFQENRPSNFCNQVTRGSCDVIVTA